MLSYQHIYHAGNLADIHKHLWLVTVLEYLKRKDTPFTWIDTHAGRGLYDLTAPEAQKIKEYESGILKYYSALNAVQSPPAPLTHYLDLIKALNPHPNDIKIYPGSAYLASKMMRLSDKFYAFDVHKGEYPYLEKNLKNYINTTIRFQDGYHGLKSLIPPTLRRGGVLIDPSYEVKDEYTDCANAILSVYKKWPQGIYMAWYPLLDKGYHVDLLDPLKALGLKEEDFIIDEWHFGNVDRGMKGSGMVIINPPYQSDKIMAAIKSFIL